MSQNVNELFQNAEEEGILSQNAMNVLTVVDIGNEIQNAMGVEIDDVQSSEVVLVTMMPDDSGSIRFSGNAQVVRDGHNMVIEALVNSKQSVNYKQKNNILAHTKYLNGDVLYPYVPIDQAIKMDQTNYDPNQGTPLYDQTVVLLGTVLAKYQEFANNGVAARTVTLVITDGADEHSKRADARMVKSIVDDMYRTEDHIIAAMGIDNNYTDFRTVFKEMGILDEWILTPGNSEGEIRKAFQVFSQSAVRASQSAASFSQTAMGGFGD